MARPPLILPYMRADFCFKDFTESEWDRNVLLELDLLLMAYDVTAPNLAVLVAALLEGSMAGYFPLQKWQRAAWLALEGSASFLLHNEQEWHDAFTVLQDARDTIAVVLNCQGNTVYDCDAPPHDDKLLFPLEVVLTDRDRCNTFPKQCTIEATGLGGGDLPFPDKADVVVRTVIGAECVWTIYEHTGTRILLQLFGL